MHILGEQKRGYTIYDDAPHRGVPSSRVYVYDVYTYVYLITVRIAEYRVRRLPSWTCVYG